MAETTSPVAGPSTPPRIAKIILIGDSGCGKTSLRNRYLRGPGSFSQAYIATIGADFVTKGVELADGTSVSVQFWDTAGQERFQALGAAFYRGADACILVYSRTSKQSYKKLESWYNSFVERYPLQEDQVKTYPFICIGNKHDLVRSTDTSNVVDEDEVETLLARLLPTLQPDIQIHEDQHPSSFHIESHPDDAREQQTREIQPHASAQHLHRRSSDTSSHRRSLEILPDTLHRSNSRGPSVYHTPSSSLAYSSWLPKQSASIPASTSPTRTASSFLRKDVPLDVVHPHEPPDSMLHGENTGTATKADDGAAASQVFGAMDGIKHFTASAKTGDNIDEIFEYVVQRISARWKWQDEQDMLNGRLSRDGPDNVRTGGKNDSIKVGDPPKAERKGWRAGCC